MSRIRIFFSASVAAVTLTVPLAPVRAGTVTPTGRSILGQPVTVKNTATAQTIRLTAGQFTWTGVSAPDDPELQGSFTSFGIELQRITNKPFQVEDLKDAPTNGGGAGFPFGDMGPDRALDLQELFGEHYQQVANENTAAAFAAFQVAIWEIVYENSANPYDAAAGQLVFLNNNAAVNRANQFLTTVGDGQATLMGGLKALTSRSNQDQVVVIAPLPAAAWMGLTLLGTLNLVRKARKPRSAE